MSLNKSLQFVKLLTGEEFFSSVTEDETGNCYFMENSIVAVDNGSGGLSFIPFLPFVQSRSFTIHGTDIMIMEKPIDEIKEAYDKHFGESSIITPPEKKIIL